ncbi:MAG: hypothetical protein KAI35_03565 [Desulfobulbaceae bacterium]|nr:hypothetical protein [Desulfobulbaceae bacterium]
MTETKLQEVREVSPLEQLPKEYLEARRKLADYLQGANPRLTKKEKKNQTSEKQVHLKIVKYEEKLSKVLHKILLLISKVLAERHAKKHGVKATIAAIQFNSVHRDLGCRVGIPWHVGYDSGNDQLWENQQIRWTKKYIAKIHAKRSARGKREVLFLQPDKPDHLLTEILWRFRSNWIGVLRDRAKAKSLQNQDKTKTVCLFGNNSKGKDDFAVEFKKELQAWRKRDKEDAAVDLSEGYGENDLKRLTDRALEWLFDNKLSHKVDNIFYLSDIMESEQIAGVAMVLDIDVVTDLTKVRKFIEDTQLLLNQYVYGLILDAEKTYSIDDTDVPYRDAYFQKVKGEYQMLDDLRHFFTLDNDELPKLDSESDLSKEFRGMPVANMQLIKDLFKKLRTHFALTKGSRGAFIRGYKNHAYEVASTVAGVMDILFQFGDYPKPKDDKKRPSIEKIVRTSDRSLKGLDDKLKDEMESDKCKIPFLFRQLFKGLSKEDQLFLIPQYREHFIHSFYVFVLGIVLMFKAPQSIIPPSINLKRDLSEDELREDLKIWFFVSMWHDIAYMVEKGNKVLEQHITSFLQPNERKKGLLPWHPSLGNLMQVSSLLQEIEELSDGAITMCDSLAAHSNLRKIFKNKQIANKKLALHIIVAIAFERYDHGIWSALMLNHGWCNKMNALFNKRDNKKAIEIRNKVAKAIIPHHIADWDISAILKDYKYVNKCLVDGCKGEGTLNYLLDDEKGVGVNCGNKKKCCNTLLASISSEGNPFGYLLGICDMISTAGREAPELSKDASDLGIQYQRIANCREEERLGSLKIVINYTKKDENTEETVRMYFKKPALYLGLKWPHDSSSEKDSLLLKIKKPELFLFNPQLTKK